MFVAAARMFRSLTFGGQAQANRDLARRARRLADSQSDPLERQRLWRYAEELEDQADRLEREATEFRPLVIAPAANDSA
jgi:hypothetical protein